MNSILKSLGLITPLVISSSALANDNYPTGQITLYKKGMATMMSARGYIDGQPIGKIFGKKKGRTYDVAAGQHEVWVTIDDNGVFTLCNGLVNVPAGRDVIVEMSISGQNFVCSNVMPGYPNGPSNFRGTFVNMTHTVDTWVSVDGGQRLALPETSLALNLSPGPHHFVFYHDVMDDTVWDQHTLTLDAGQSARVTCTEAGCLGFDAPPVQIVEIAAAPQLVLVGGTPFSQVTTTTTTTTGGGGIGMAVSADGMSAGISVGGGGMTVGGGGVSVNIGGMGGTVQETTTTTVVNSQPVAVATVAPVVAQPLPDRVRLTFRSLDGEWVDIRVDGKVVAEMRNDDEVSVYVTPGVHTVEFLEFMEDQPYASGRLDTDYAEQVTFGLTENSPAVVYDHDGWRGR